MFSPLGATLLLLCVIYVWRYLLQKRLSILHFALIVVLIGVAWYPHSLLRNERLGYDFKCYYEAGRGNTSYSVSSVDGPIFWSYPNHTEYLWSWCHWFFFPMAFAVQYLFSIFSWVILVYSLWKLGEPGIFLSCLTAYPMLLSLEAGNVQPILTACCLFPFTCVLAAFVKPYLLGFVLLHIITILYSRKCTSVHCDKGKSDATADRVCSPYADPDISGFELSEVIRKAGWK